MLPPVGHVILHVWQPHQSAAIVCALVWRALLCRMLAALCQRGAANGFACLVFRQYGRQFRFCSRDCAMLCTRSAPLALLWSLPLWLMQPTTRRILPRPSTLNDICDSRPITDLVPLGRLELGLSNRHSSRSIRLFVGGIHSRWPCASDHAIG